MKLVAICALLFVLPSVCRGAYDEPFKQAILHGAMAKVCFRVVDDEGAPVSNATAHVWFSSYGRHQDDADWLVDTDANGMFIVSHRTNEQLAWLVRKEGYYQTHGNILFRDRKVDGAKVVDEKWQPYGETRTVVLKKIKNPKVCPIVEQEIIDIPVYGEWLAFDLERFAWLHPYGNGKAPDVLLRFSRSVKNMQNDFKSVMQVSFTNNPYGGFYEMRKDDFSEMKCTYEADTNMVYRTMVDYRFERRPGKQDVRDMLAEGSYIVFRTRTKVDKHYRLVSAHYGIIGGRWGLHGAMRLGSGVFNPTPNDTNLEDAETARKSRLGYKQQLEFERRRKAKGM